MSFRQVWALMLAVLMLGVTNAARADEPNTDRPGSDYTNFTIPPFSGGARACDTACDDDARCRAWSFVRTPGLPGAGGQCWLKDRVPAPTPDACCVSGVKAGGGGGPGGGGGRSGITIYEDVGFAGSSQSYTTDQPNLVSEGWNDLVSSFRISGGETWEVCQDINYGGACRRFTSDQANLVSIGWNDRISSFRKVGAGGPGPGPGPGPGWDDDYEIEPGMRDGVDRPGSDYRSFLPSRREGPSACQNACEDENECRAWAFKRPSGPGDRGRCYLKGIAPAEVRDRTVISGVSRNRDVIGRGMEENTDRAGSDYRDLDLTSADPRLCQRECERDRSCRAWTYVRPGVQGENPRCYLKSPAPGASRNDCCVSGVIGGGVLPPPPSSFLDNTMYRGRILSDFRTDGPPDTCRRACEANGSCSAWQYMKPGYSGRRAKCFLYRGDVTTERNECCIAGPRRGAGGPPPREVIGPGMRDNSDRPGFDLRPPFLLMAPNPELCRDACFAEFGCRAWVYSRPGSLHPSRATCTLKSIPGPRIDAPCCITGGRSSLF